MPRYAEVALPLGVDRTFTYMIPPDLADAASIGCRTIVPFGRRYATGLIVGLAAETDLSAVKPLHDVVDPAPLVSPELLRLCRWVAEYYLAPLGEVLKAALPHAFAGVGKRIVHPLPHSIADPHTGRGKGKAHILDLLARHGSLSVTALQKRTGLRTINAVLTSLEREGLITIEELLPAPQGSAKVQRFLDLAGTDPELLAGAIARTPARRKRVLRLLGHLHSSLAAGATELSVIETLKATGATGAHLHSLVNDGLVRITERQVSRQQEYGTDETVRSLVLNDQQRTALTRITAALDAGAHRTFLLHGVTGSGKTQVYIEAIRHCLAAGKDTIVLVPEISLTPQIVRRFRTHFGDGVAVVHSRMSAGERHDVWRSALRGLIRVVIGPRSAVFAPIRNPGLIVVDEEHESSYKQYDADPRYHARDTAVIRGSFSSAVVLLGSATPSAESAYNAAAGKYELLRMPERVRRIRMPDVAIVDMTAERRREYASARESVTPERRNTLRQFRQSSLSALLRERIDDRLTRGEGIILLQNRRGFAPFMECLECGHTEMCDRCQVTLTYHLPKKQLRCHYCGLVRVPPSMCPQCNGIQLELRGIGTQRVEEELEALFPGVSIARMDLDTTTRKGAHERILRRFADGEADILLGTQMVAKGLDFPRVTLVGVISADTQMLLPDFRASERTFQLLTQVAGRAGRSELHGEVLIQTHQANHPVLQHVITQRYGEFLEEELAARRELHYPPFARLVLIEFRGGNEGEVQRHAERFSRLITASDVLTPLGPTPAVIGRIRNMYRWHLLLKNDKSADPTGVRMRTVVRHALAEFSPTRTRSVRVSIDVDPQGLL